MPPPTVNIAAAASLAATAFATACNVATVGGPLVFKSDAAGAATEAGPSSPTPDAGAALVGDPCSTDGDCASGTCADSTWCTASCANGASCGANSAGVPNVCAMASTGQTVCYPGCSPTTGCQAFAGTTCTTLPSGGAACSP